MTNITKAKTSKRMRRHRRIRARLSGTSECPRLAVFRSNRYISAQLINDETGKTLLALSSRGLKSAGTPRERANELGKQLAIAAKEHGVQKVVFDRGGFMYTGSIKSLADGAREGGLAF